jgi:diketogulonate reductase-like aldo/keto reductase
MPDPTLDTGQNRGVALRDAGVLPLLGFGTWQLRGREAYDAVRVALDVGYRHIDTATMYRNEEQVGAALRDAAIDRSEVFLTTKLPAQATGRERATLEESLRKLGTDYVDLWLVHWPPDGSASPDVWRAFLSARDAGLARSVGVSNYSTGQVDELIDATGETPSVNQVRWSPALYDPARVEHHQARGVVLEGYSPFKASRLDDPVLRAVADAHGVEPTQVILRWHVDTRTVVIPKSANPERIAANFDIWGFRLTPDEIARINALASG